MAIVAKTSREMVIPNKDYDHYHDGNVDGIDGAHEPADDLEKCLENARGLASVVSGIDEAKERGLLLVMVVALLERVNINFAACEDREEFGGHLFNVLVFVRWINCVPKGVGNRRVGERCNVLSKSLNGGNCRRSGTIDEGEGKDDSAHLNEGEAVLCITKPSYDELYPNNAMLLPPTIHTIGALNILCFLTSL
ncbi:hypothetical protein BC937DRAFT_90083 [Endogone sp. FLAS-F59071]|nr:hypothetical protein BC937DRAFT_90083 [Endogone sp. FLAS-F59071]|eukprot:RUS17355.1 hypothetical protein BC937DRAFT_90083 [Endogone sp. FLAS-F59071]